MTNKAEGTHLVSDEKILQYASQYVQPNAKEVRRACEHIRDIYEADRYALLREKDATIAFMKDLESAALMNRHMVAAERIRTFLSTLTPDQK